ncbi:MAG: hypothetical protein FH756_10965 [Firmicutes bacterium]|nr:hypothetical protein [Bacillota bacterium]
MLKKICFKISPTLSLFFLTAKSANAANYGGIDVTDGGSLGTKIVEVVQQVGMPIGGGLLFLSVVAVAIMMMTSAFKPDKKASAMGALGYVAGGGIILGAAMFIAGALLGIGEKLQ